VVRRGDARQDLRHHAPGRHRDGGARTFGPRARGRRAVAIVRQNPKMLSADCPGAPFRERVRPTASKRKLPMANPLPRACKSINDLNVGDTFRLKYSVSDADVQKFGEISGDFNPAHFNEEYAKGTVFKGRIAHGMISLAKFSGIFGMDMPG